jgi:Fe-S cluster assembly protein SufD
MTQTLQSQQGDTLIPWYLSQFKENKERGEQKTPPLLSRFRQEAIQRFELLGFPNVHQESWKYTPLTPLLQEKFCPSAPPLTAQTPLPPKVQSLKESLGEEALYFVFLNGYFQKEWSSVLPSEVSLFSPLLCSNSEEEWISYFEDTDSLSEDPFVALNTALNFEGVYVKVAPQTVLEKPLYFFYLSSETPKALSFSCPRLILALGKGSQATCIEWYLGEDPEKYFTNTLTQIELQECARLQYYRIQEESLSAYHLGRTEVRQKRESFFSAHSIALGGSIGRHHLQIALQEEAVETQLNGFYFAKEKQLLDQSTFVEHFLPQGNTREYYKGILLGEARGAFYGKIRVHPLAQKTDAQLRNKNLLLSSSARVDTKPQLEIFADDVKCGHGATVGQLEENALFYFQTRGISKKEAQALLTNAFAGEILNSIPHAALRQVLEARLWNQIHHFIQREASWKP